MPATGRIGALLCALGLALAIPAMAQPAGSAPDRSLTLRAAIDRVRAEFVDEVAAVSGIARDRVRTWMPQDCKRNHAEFKIIYAVERERGTRLANEERLRILQAEDRMRAAIDRAGLDALRR